MIKKLIKLLIKIFLALAIVLELLVIVITEENSKNTIENLEFASDIAGKDKKYLIVSNGFHMFRLDLISKYIGIKHELYSAKTPQDILVKNYLQEVASIFYLAFKIVTGKV